MVSFVTYANVIHKTVTELSLTIKLFTFIHRVPSIRSNLNGSSIMSLSSQQKSTCERYVPLILSGLLSMHHHFSNLAVLPSSPSIRRSRRLILSLTNMTAIQIHGESRVSESHTTIQLESLVK